ncbi:MAG: glycosyltransferase, partial [Acidobacteriota bacterium]
MPRRKALIILGMHRSGTSVLTALINRLGAAISSKVSPGAQDNPDGYFEPLTLPSIHDAFTAAFGLHWHDPAPLPPEAFESPEAKACVQAIVDLLKTDFLDTPLFVVKDPRISRVAPLWIRALKEFEADPHFLIAVRNPMEVALSLEKRNAFPLAKSQLAWLGHTLDAERFTREHPRVFCHYDEIFGDFASLAGRIAARLGVSWPKEGELREVQDSGVIKLDYRHHHLSLEETAAHPETLPWSLRAYRALLAHIATGKPGALKPLRAVWEGFEAAVPAFSLLQRDAEEAGARAAIQEQALHAEYASRLEERARRISSLERRIIELVDDATQARASCSALRKELAAMSQRVALEPGAAENSAGIAAKAAELEDRLSGSEALLEARTREIEALREELQAERRERLAKTDMFADLLAKNQASLNIATSHGDRLEEEITRLAAELEATKNHAERQRQALAETAREAAASRNSMARQARLLQVSGEKIEQARNSALQSRDTLHALLKEFCLRSINLSGPGAQSLRSVLFGEPALQRAGIPRDARSLPEAFQALSSGERSSITPLFEDWWYLERHPEAAVSGLAPLEHYLREGAASGFEPSPVFDSGYYFECLGLEGQPPCDALSHYCAAGADQGASPHPLFDPAHYLKQAPEATAGGLAPLAHYLLHGGKASPHPAFDPAYYLAQCSQTPDQPLLRHYLTTGSAEGLSPHPLFDRKHYLAHSPDVAESGMDPLLHYLAWGWMEDRTPHPLFDPAYFRERMQLDGPPESNPLLLYLSLPPLERPSTHPLFDAPYYIRRNPDVAGAGYDPLLHYLRTGGYEKRNPHPLFDSEYYLSSNPDVAEAMLNPLAHFVEHGGADGRKPHPLFDSALYLRNNPDVAEAGSNPLVHFLRYGWAEGRTPHPLFDPAYYLEHNQDVAKAGINPLRHFVESGGIEGRRPHPLFDSRYYLAHCPEAEAKRINPLVHWLRGDNQHIYNPSAAFDTPYYLSVHPDVAAKGENPLVHYLRHGANGPTATPKARNQAHYVPKPGQLPGLNPLNLAIDAALARAPRLNLLLPSLAMRHMSGGPNTAVNIGYHLAAKGVDVRFIGTDAPMDADPELFHTHATVLSGLPRQERITLADAHDRSKPLFIGENDIFFATAWWTAQMVKYALPLTRRKRFIYLIQDYEPILYPASSPYAMAQETYDLDFVPLVNTSLLMEFLQANRIGRFADPEFASRAIVFEPAVCRQAFYPEAREDTERRRLLFYARPTKGKRNLFEIGVTALRKAVAEGVFDPCQWEFLGMGENFKPVALGQGAVLRPAPWLDFNAYAAQMRQADILLSLMLSPHPSYPPLEMAACGKPCVTNTYATKDADKLHSLSPNLIAVPPTVEDLAAALAAASEMPAGEGSLGLPSSWEEVIEGMMPPLLESLAIMSDSPMGEPVPAGPDDAPQGLAVLPGYEGWPSSPYDVHRRQRLARRRNVRPQAPPPALFSFLTTVWNTDPKYVSALAATVFNQEGGLDWEWVILDNGSTRPEVVALLRRLSEHPRVRLFRVEENAGIIGGMRMVLEQARNRYVLPLDSDDLLTPDCLRLLAERLERAGWPPICYTDEDKVLEGAFRDPYFKPDFDPVLLFHSCYIAHLGAFDRETALELGVYDDPKSEGCHDWDTFLRFYVAGHTPVHLDEVVYTWRMHLQSTAMNIGSKSYIHDSHQHLLNKFLHSRVSGYRFSLERSTLFQGSPDWRFVRGGQSLTPVLSVVVGHCAPESPGPLPDLPHRQLFLPTLDFDLLEQIASNCLRSGELIHLRDGAAVPRDGEWFTEAQGLMELFPDTVMVGGPVYEQGRVAFAGMAFGLDDGLVTPEKGRVESDPGYFAQMWKPHSACAVPALHAVIDPGFLLMALRRLATLEDRPSLVCLGTWLGALARCEGRRVVYTPFMKSDLKSPRDTAPSLRQRHLLRLCHGDLARDSSLYSPLLSRDPARAYQPAFPGEAAPPVPPLEDYAAYHGLAAQAAR